MKKWKNGCKNDARDASTMYQSRDYRKWIGRSRNLYFNMSFLWITRDIKDRTNQNIFKLKLELTNLDKKTHLIYQEGIELYVRVLLHEIKDTE